MKHSLLVLIFLSLTSVSYANFDHHHDHDYDHSEEIHNPNATEDVLYLSNEQANSLRDKAFQYIVIDENTGEETISPLGDTNFPYSAIGQISKVMPASGGVGAFKMSRVKASFDENQKHIDDAFREGQYYSVEDNMIFLRADGHTVTTFDSATYVILPEFISSDIEELLEVKWNECQNRHFRGNYDDGDLTLSCSRNRVMHDEFRGLLERNLLSCVNDSLKSIGRATSPDVYIVHKGTAADKLHSSGSMHQQGKAIDIRVVRVTGADGKKYDINYARAVRGNPGWRKRFYQNFRTCWGQVQLARSSKCVSNNMRYNRANNLPYYGSIGWEDSKHRIHMHISMPPCGTRRI